MIAPWANEKVLRLYERPEIKASIEIVLSVFAITFLIAFAIRPTLTTVAQLQKKLDDQTLVERKMTTKITQLSRAQSDLSQYADKLSLFDQAIPNEHELPEIEKRIELLVSENGLTLNSITYDSVPVFGENIKLVTEKAKGAQKPPVEPGTTIAFFEVVFDLTGNQDQISNFVERLEAMDRILIVSSIDIQRQEIRVGEGQPARSGLKVIGKAFGYYQTKKAQ